MSEHIIEDRKVKKSECGRFGKLINGVYRPAGYKYKVKIKKPTEPKGAN